MVQSKFGNHHAILKHFQHGVMIAICCFFVTGFWMLFTKIVRNNMVTMTTTTSSVAMALSTAWNNNQHTKWAKKRGQWWSGARLSASKSNAVNLILRLFFVPFLTYNELVTSQVHPQQHKQPTNTTIMVMEPLAPPAAWILWYHDRPRGGRPCTYLFRGRCQRVLFDSLN